MRISNFRQSGLFRGAVALTLMSIGANLGAFYLGVKFIDSVKYRPSISEVYTGMWPSLFLVGCAQISANFTIGLLLFVTPRTPLQRSYTLILRLIAMLSGLPLATAFGIAFWPVVSQKTRAFSRI